MAPKPASTAGKAPVSIASKAPASPPSFSSAAAFCHHHHDVPPSYLLLYLPQWHPNLHLPQAKHQHHHPPSVLQPLSATTTTMYHLVTYFKFIYRNGTQTCIYRRQSTSIYRQKGIYTASNVAAKRITEAGKKKPAVAPVDAEGISNICRIHLHHLPGYPNNKSIHILTNSIIQSTINFES
jgi:hypothetical protein